MKTTITGVHFVTLARTNIGKRYRRDAYVDFVLTVFFALQFLYCLGHWLKLNHLPQLNFNQELLWWANLSGMSVSIVILIVLATLCPGRLDRAYDKCIHAGEKPWDESK